MDPFVGKTLGKYKIEALLGEGGMGAVYKARHMQLGHDVAIKMMHAQFARLREFRARFLQEAQTAARLDHPGIVKVHDFVEAPDMLYIIMEFIRGNNLQQMLEEQRSQKQWIPLNEAVQLIRQVGAALDHAHRHGVLHRDIKPANIMLKLDPESPERIQPIITDLGLAKLSQGGLVTQANATMGTPAYMSPEQLQGDNIDARSDVYSLGVLLYELAVGRRPFPIRSMTEAIRYHTREQPPTPRAIRPDLPPALERIILRAMAKIPADRFPSAAAMVQALTTIASGDLPATVPATAREAQSLYTQVQESLVVDRGASLIQEFPQPSVMRSGVDQLQIMAPDGAARTQSVKGRRLIIGRDDGCDLPLKNDDKVSRQHARIEFDGQAYWVIDLDSMNGTRLGAKKLKPNVAEAWPAGLPLRIGKHTIRLLRSTTPPPPAKPATQSAQTYKEIKAPAFTQMETNLPITPPKAANPGLMAAKAQENRAVRQAGRWAIWLLTGLLVAGVSGLTWRLHLLSVFFPALPFGPVASATVTLTPSPAPTEAATTPAQPTATPAPPTATLAPPDTATPTAPPLSPTVAASPTPVAPPTETPAPPTSTPVPTSTIVPSPTPLPTSTPRPPTNTPRPTNTPLPTNTPIPPTNTPRPLPTPTNPQGPTEAPPVSGASNSGGLHFGASVQIICNDARPEVLFEGRVFISGQPQNGYRVAFKSRKVPGTAPATDPAITGPDGGHSDWPTGYYSHIVDGNKATAKGKSLEVWVMDGSGAQISDYGFWQTDGATGSCNKAIINFSAP